MDKLVINPGPNPVDVRSFRLIKMAPGEQLVMRDLKEQHIPRLKKLGLVVKDLDETPEEPQVLTEPAPIPSPPSPPAPDPVEEEGEGETEEGEDKKSSLDLLMEKSKEDLMKDAAALDLPTYGTKKDIAERIIDKVGEDFLGS